MVSGSSSTLTWLATNATACTAAGAANWTGSKTTAGSLVIAPTATTTYMLTCTGAAGTSAASGNVTVTVTQPGAPILTFSASPTNVLPGNSSTLTWSSANVSSCTASGASNWTGSKPTSGSVTITPTATSTYTVTCTGAAGTTPATQSLTVAVTPQPTATLAASPTTVGAGSAATLTWSSTNATACTASGGSFTGAVATSGSASTGTLNANTTYSVTCAGAAGTTPASATAAVAVTPQPTVTNFSANPASVTSGGSSTLSWSTTNATSCTGSGGTFTGPKLSSGTASTGTLTANASYTQTYTLTCVGGTGTTPATATATVTVTPPSSTSLAVSPRNAALTLSQTQQFTATQGGNAATVSWLVDGNLGGTVATGTISSSGVYTPPTTPGTHTVTAQTLDGNQNAAAAVAITDLAGIYTFHNDIARTGANLQEYALTPATVSSGNFGKQFQCTTDGEITAQPLYVANLSIGGGTHNVVFVVTQNDSVYAFDADATNCTTYWVNTYVAVNAPTGATSYALSTDATAPNYLDLVGPFNQGGCNDMIRFGITSTPVIDPASQTMYFVATTKENKTGGTWSYYQRLHAINITTGTELANSPTNITATAAGSGNGGSTVSFSPLWQNQRSGLVLTNGGIYISWGSHCDIQPYWGWVMRYDATSLQQTSVFLVTPNGSKGGIWMSAGAAAVDTSGSLFMSTGNGTFDTGATVPAAAPNNDFAMSFLNFNTSQPTIAVQDFYTPTHELGWSNADLDISASGVTVIPDGLGPTGHPNLLTGSDKQGHLWLIDRAVGNMSQYNPGGDATVQYLQLPVTSNCTGKNCLLGAPAYYHNANASTDTVYFGPSQNSVMALTLTGGLYPVANSQNFAAPSSYSTETYGYPGTTPAVSASPAGGGIVWVLDNSKFGAQGNNGASVAGTSILRAYDAGTLNTLFDSSASTANTNGNAIKFTRPVIANGHVYVGGDGAYGGGNNPTPAGQLTVYGLAP